MSRKNNIDQMPNGDALIISEALLNAKERLSLTGDEIYEITGIHPSRISRMKNQGKPLNDRKIMQIALHFLRLYRSLDSITGNDKTSAEWLKNNNLALGGKPIDIIKDIGGLINVVAYLDGRRAPV